MNGAPIGVFDSGLGGLTVVSAIRAALPNEALVYLGDTARVPYGTRSAETVIRYARSCALHLLRHRVKMIVVACNTVSAVALDMLRVEHDLPVLGVIVPGARAGVRASTGGRIGVIATAGTVRSGAYVRAAASVDTRVEVFAQAAPLLVPLVEEGWLEGEVPRQAVRRYLEPLVAREVDSLVLGCTHYPLLEQVIERELADLSGKALPVVDSARATADELGHVLRERSLERSSNEAAPLRIYVTDLGDRFDEVASRFLGSTMQGTVVEQVDL
jgi:glutamate racemase